jgi:cellobiose phosphorylase
MLAGIHRALGKRSSRGLPLIGAGDWNDGLSHAGIDGKGESVWLAMFLFDILNRLNPVLREMGMGEEASLHAQAASELQEAVDRHAWDGEWFIAGTRDDGKPLGSRTCTDGAISLNPQTWSVISGIASKERQEQAIDSVRKQLLKPYGALLLAPAYRKVDPYVGYITRYAPGLRENGGVYSHASTWAIQALAMLGDVEGAYGLFRGMMPPLRSSQNPDLYASEPYVMPGNIDGPDSPYEGRAGWTWYTGSAAWMRRMAVERILGVRATREGLLISPSLPNGWTGFTMRRPFRGDVLAIAVEGRHTSYEIVAPGADMNGAFINGPGNGSCLSVRLIGRP